MLMFEQNERIIIDYDGNRWAKCTICGKIDYVDNFATYGKLGQINKGKCTECIRKIVQWMEN